MKKKVVIAGFGDTGVLVAIYLAGNYDIVGISPKPCLLSGQELGTRLAQPERWKRNYLIPFDSYKKLKAVKTLQGLITAIDSQTNTVSVALADGGELQQHYDVLVIASGVSNGFWRNNRIENMDSIQQNLTEYSRRLSQAKDLAIIGGGASGVSAALNQAKQHPYKRIDFFYSQAQPLPGYHPRVRARLVKELEDSGVELHPQHRAIIPEGFACDRLSNSAVQWSSGQPPFHADVTLWTTGNTRPNNAFIDPQMLDEQGFVKTDGNLRVPGFDNIFSVGDIAATDPNRSSARNSAYRLVANNIHAYCQQREQKMKVYKASPYRWGSIVGVQANGLKVFSPGGGSMRFPKWLVNTLLFPIIVRRGIYKGVKKTRKYQAALKTE